MHCRSFSLELAQPLQTAAGTIAEREGLLVGVTPQDDPVSEPGVGEACPLPGWTEPLATCREALRRYDGLQEHPGDSQSPDLRPLEETPAARHAVSLAYADAAARHDSKPLSETLANDSDFGMPAQRVPLNATIGAVPPEKAEARARQIAEDGYPAVKVKVGSGNDRDRLRAVRRGVPTLELRADANGVWDRQTARTVLEDVADLDVSYVEQPLPAADLDGHRRLREETPIDVALDESLASVGLDRVLEADVCDVVILKPMVLGGPDRAVAAAARAREAGVEPVVTTTIDAVVARTAAVHVAAAIPDVQPCGLATGSLLRCDLGPSPSPIVDGTIAVPTAPGLAGDSFDDLV